MRQIVFGAGNESVPVEMIIYYLYILNNAIPKPFSSIRMAASIEERLINVESMGRNEKLTK